VSAKKDAKADALRARAEQHRAIAKLYDRRAAKQELAGNLERYKTELAENAAELERLEAETKKLEADLRNDATEVKRV
jgi:hypothetical protein